MSFGVEHAINPSTPKSIFGIGNDFRSFSFSVREMLVNIVDIDLDLHALRYTVCVLLTGLTWDIDVKQRVPRLDPGLSAAGPRQPCLRALVEAEHALEPLDGARQVRILN